jgi:hypothetical protein
MKEAETRAKTRGEEALKTEFKMIQKRVEEENSLKEQRAEVIQKENEIAKEVAQKNRERQAVLLEEKKREEMMNYVRPGGTLVYGKIDYSKTHFHNPVILVHDKEGKNAIQLAQEEHQAELERFEILKETRIANEKKAENRGQEALIQVAVRRDLAKLQKELEKIRVADGENKIERGQKDSTAQNRCVVKNTQDFVKKQERLEKAFENIFAEEVLVEDLNEKYLVKPVGLKNLKSQAKKELENSDEVRVHEIPMPVVENNFEQTEKTEKIENDFKESQGFAKKYLTKKKSESIDSQSEDFELSQSESEEEDPMRAKYISKPSKKPRKPLKKKKKNDSISLKKSEKSPKDANLSESSDRSKPEGDYKDHLQEEYQKHLQIKKKIEELKKYSDEPVKRPPEPPSVLSSQLSPHSLPFEKPSIDEDLYSFPKKVENLGLYSKIKDQLAPGKTPESSIDEGGNDLGSNFLEEMKVKYGIQSSSKKSESEGSQKKDLSEKTPIFSDRTLKLMKEIEEKYSLDKYKVSDDYEEELRYTLPFAKVVEKPESPKFNREPVSSEPSESRAEDLQSEKSSEINSDFEKIKKKYFSEKVIEGHFSSKSSESQEYKSQDHEENSENYENYENYENSENSESHQNSDEDLQPRQAKPSQTSQDLEDDGKFSFNEKFFSDLKAKYGIGSKEEDSEESPLPPKLSKNEDLLIEDQEVRGKSLAEIFKERNQKAMSKINDRESSLVKASYKEKSKEELAEIRKDLMKNKHEKNPEPEEIKTNPVLERLSKGEKPKISKKEMHSLTKKNYDLLPEVKKKREEERKKQELRERIQKSKEFEKVRNMQKRQEQREFK